jgi:23S rRNA pseudouridine955/2504/2580 synthase
MPLICIQWKPVLKSTLEYSSNIEGEQIIKTSYNSHLAILFSMMRSMKHESASQSSTILQASFASIDADQAGQRLDNFLMARLKGVPKSRIYNAIRKGEVRVNKGRSKPEYKLAAGDQIRIPPIRVSGEKEVAKASNQIQKLLNDSILYEDEGLLVINKPAGLAVHGGSGINLGLIETLRQMRPDARYLELVHRLDRDTSGCIMIAKKRSYLRFLQAALREKSQQEISTGDVKKAYQALVIGQWPDNKKKIDVPLLKMELNQDERIVKVHPEGKSSLTEFSVLSRYQGFSLIEAKPITGRTHQIRVHAQYAGHSLVGDEKYGHDETNLRMRELGFKRLFLHASALSFYLPNSTDMVEVKAPLPMDLAKPLSLLQPYKV